MIWAIISLALGGILKGATGAGTPVLAVPVMAMFFGVDVAIVTMLIPNLVNNFWQGWQFRESLMPRRFMVVFNIAGMVGVVIGTWLLVSLSPKILLLMVAFGVFSFIAFRLARPGWQVPERLHQMLAAPVGVLSGILQGAAGVSAPVSITFLNAMRLTRPVFIGTISWFFAWMTVAQLPALALSGVLTWERLGYSLGALALISAFMPLGGKIGKRVSRETFDKALLTLLFLISVKIVVDALRAGAA
jgi:uncharacterized membrane protein YfcA